ncbi:unnamed protein product [Linum tenue]|uniref:Uncharacterized protein n=1 Tax=Linum tenue TaxID=586396 RepID=A0AAV0PE37_9ROSI|nr:unnamed protein product [Linum tenue]
MWSRIRMLAERCTKRPRARIRQSRSTTGCCIRCCSERRMRTLP